MVVQILPSGMVRQNAFFLHGTQAKQKKNACGKDLPFAGLNPPTLYNCHVNLIYHLCVLVVQERKVKDLDPQGCLWCCLRSTRLDEGFKAKEHQCTNDGSA